MKQKTNLVAFVICMILTTISCNCPDCENKNPIFDKYDINSVEYKIELIKQIEKIGQENLTYWFDSYINENEKDYIIVNMQNDSLCAKGKLLVNNWNKIEGIKRTKGQSYAGAELKGLTYNIEKDTNKIEFIYKDLVRIID